MCEDVEEEQRGTRQIIYCERASFICVCVLWRRCGSDYLATMPIFQRRDSPLRSKTPLFETWRKIETAPQSRQSLVTEATFSTDQIDAMLISCAVNLIRWKCGFRYKALPALGRRLIFPPRFKQWSLRPQRTISRWKIGMVVSNQNRIFVTSKRLWERCALIPINNLSCPAFPPFASAPRPPAFYFGLTQTKIAK